MKYLLLSPEIFVAATKAPSGPPAMLFNAYVGVRDNVEYITTPWLRQQIIEGLIAAGYNEDTAKEQAEFIGSLGHMIEDPDDLGKDPLIAIAKAANVDKVYHASGREGTVDGVTFVPVGELQTVLAELA